MVTLDEREEIVLPLISTDLPFPVNPPMCQSSSVHIYRMHRTFLSDSQLELSYRPNNEYPARSIDIAKQFVDRRIKSTKQ